MPTVLKNGAVIVADSHYSTKNPKFLNFLKDLQLNKIETEQIIFLGDNFDLLIGEIKETCIENNEAIDLINKIAISKQIYYLEGNHDFNLKKIFCNIKIVPIEKQPLKLEANSKKIWFFHGDNNNGIFHTIFTYFIRNTIFLRLLNLITLNFINGKFAKNKIESLKRKIICSKIDFFEELIRKKYKNSTDEFDILLEGHYHQGANFLINSSRYLNIESFACNQSYIVVECTQNDIKFKRVLF